MALPLSHESEASPEAGAVPMRFPGPSSELVFTLGFGVWLLVAGHRFWTPYTQWISLVMTSLGLLSLGVAVLVAIWMPRSLSDGMGVKEVAFLSAVVAGLFLPRVEDMFWLLWLGDYRSNPELFNWVIQMRTYSAWAYISLASSGILALAVLRWRRRNGWKTHEHG